MTATLLCTLVLFVAGLSTSGALKCYICKNAKSNDECNRPEHLQDCRERSVTLLDVCETSVRTKECMKSPCVLQSKDASKALNIQRCVNNVCRSCCDSDGCNKDTASTHKPIYSLIFVVLFLAVLYSSL